MANSVAAIQILLIFGTRNKFGLQMPCEKYEHCMISEQSVKAHYNFGKSLTLMVKT